MKSYTADVKMRFIGGLLWMAAIFAFVVGRRMIHAVDNPDYSVAGLVYALGIGIPLLLILLPRVVTAIGIDFSQNAICLRYLRGGVRVYEPGTVQLKTGNRSVAIIEGTLLDGSEKTSFLHSGGFSKQDWEELLVQLDRLYSIDQTTQNQQ